MRKFITVIFLLLVSIGIKSYASPVKIIPVETTGLSMVFTVSENKKVIYQYFGDKISSNSQTIFLNRKYKPRRDGRSLAPEVFPAAGDFLDPALQLTHSDGVITTDLYYVGHDIKDIDANVVETKICLKDKLYPLFVNVIFKAYKKENVITQYIELENKEKDDIRIEKIASAYIPLHKKAYYLTHFHGGW